MKLDLHTRLNICTIFSFANILILHQLMCDAMAEVADLTLAAHYTGPGNGISIFSQQRRRSACIMPEVKHE